MFTEVTLGGLYPDPIKVGNLLKSAELIRELYRTLYHKSVRLVGY